MMRGISMVGPCKATPAQAPANGSFRPAQGRVELLGGTPEAAFALAIGINGLIQRFAVEIGPQTSGEVELGVGQLPEQEVADALLAAGADEQIRLGRVGSSTVRRRTPPR